MPDCVPGVYLYHLCTYITCGTGVFLITSLVGAVAKYCDEHVYVCLSVFREHISGSRCVIFSKFFVYVACGHGSVLLWQGDKIPRGKGNLGFCSLLIMYCNAFTAEGIIQLPITSCSRRYHSVTAAFAAKGIIQYRSGSW